MKILVVGSGGREHSLCWAIAKSPKCDELFCAPGNAGIEAIANCVEIADDDVNALVAFAKDQEINFVVVGPEAPLVNGLIDKLNALNIRAFGPSAAAAELEGSKGFMKDLCSKYKIPSAKYSRFSKPEDAKKFIAHHQIPLVVKADGIAAGKGVIICRNKQEAIEAVDHIMIERAFGGAGNEIIIEEYLEGEEASFFALVDGKNILSLRSAQDHKAAYDGDKGPNTGGMGAYSPAPIIDNSMTEQILKEIIKPTVEAMALESRPYKGVLYAGLMITSTGPRLIEYNVRFGDPECQPLMVALKSDILDMLIASADGTLDKIKLQWHDEVTLIVVMAAQGYPGVYQKGTEIKGVAKANAIDDVFIFHAGTKSKNGKLIAAGGRVLGVTSKAKTVAAAQKLAYKAVEKIDWPDGFNRTDIGWRALNRLK